MSGAGIIGGEFFLITLALFGIMVAECLAIWHAVKRDTAYEKVSARQLELAEQNTDLAHKSHAVSQESFDAAKEKIYWEGFRKGLDKGRSNIALQEGKELPTSG
jgi:hypothetical protein